MIRRIQEIWATTIQHADHRPPRKIEILNGVVRLVETNNFFCVRA